MNWIVHRAQDSSSGNERYRYRYRSLRTLPSVYVLYSSILAKHDHCGWRTRRENGFNELLPGNKSGSFSVKTTKEVHVLEFVGSRPRHVALSPLVKVEVLETLRLTSATQRACLTIRRNNAVVDMLYRRFPANHFPGQTFPGQVILRNFQVHSVCKYQLYRLVTLYVGIWRVYWSVLVGLQ